MSSKKVRVTMKNDTSDNWTTAGQHNFIPLAGEIIFYSDLNKIKVGDGQTNINDLLFLNDNNTESDIKSFIDKEYITSLLNFYNGDISLDKEV